jgi:hypothetical protein
VGWVALAPFEVVHPWWGRGLYAGFRGGVYANHTSIVNNASVASAYRNARVAGGAVGMNTAGFGRGGQITSLNRSQIQSAGLVHGVVPVAPDRSSLRMSDRSVSGRFPQSSAQSFASRMQTPHVEHASFDQQQRGMQQMSRSNFSSPAGRGSVGASESAAHGWNRFGEPIHGTAGGGAASPYSRSYSSPAQSRDASGGGYYSRSNGGGSAVRISPSIVAPRSNAAPRSNPAPRSSGGGSARPSGGGAHSGGGGHGGGGHH